MIYQPGISIVIPVYHSELSIPELLKRVSDSMAKQERKWEMILVDDCSTDDSWRMIRESLSRYPNLVGLRLARNSGQHAALLAGIRESVYSITVTIDDDLQHRPEDILALVQKVEAGADLVYGISITEEHSIWRNLSSRFSKRIISITVGSKHARLMSAFRAFSTELREDWIGTSDPFVVIDVLLAWTTENIDFVNLEMDKRALGKSNYTLRTLIRHLVNMTTGYSIKPLRLVTYIGLLFSSFGLVVLIYVLCGRFLNQSESPGFVFITSLISILGGLQLFALGILGEYLGRIHVRSTLQPSYIIRELAREES